MMSRVAFEVVYAQKKSEGRACIRGFRRVDKKWMMTSIEVIDRALSGDHVYTAITTFSLEP